MSSSELGTIAIMDETNANVYNVDLMNVEFPDGWAWDILQRIAAPVTGMGVDGTRMRLIRNDFPRFRMVTYSDFGTFDDAVTAGVAVIGYARYRAQLTYICAGVTYTPADLAYIWDVQCRPIRCELVSAVAPPGQQALLRCDWVFQFNQGT
jgi:hypothetical protein